MESSKKLLSFTRSSANCDFEILVHYAREGLLEGHPLGAEAGLVFFSSRSSLEKKTPLDQLHHLDRDE